MKALIDDTLSQLSPIKTDPDLNLDLKLPQDDDDNFRLLPVPIKNSNHHQLKVTSPQFQSAVKNSTRMNSDLNDVLVDGKKHDSFSQLTGFPTPTKSSPQLMEFHESLHKSNSPLKTMIPVARYTSNKAKQVRELLESKTYARLVDPLLEDFKKEQERLRSKPVYIDPEEMLKQRTLEARKEAAEIVNDYPLDTNQYGKQKLALIEKISKRKLEGQQMHLQHRRTDTLSQAPPVEDPHGKLLQKQTSRITLLKQQKEEMKRKNQFYSPDASPSQQDGVHYMAPRGMGSVHGSTRLGRQY